MPFTELLGEVMLVKFPVPALSVQIPVPCTGRFAASIALLPHTVLSFPANEEEGSAEKTTGVPFATDRQGSLKSIAPEPLSFPATAEM